MRPIVTDTYDFSTLIRSGSVHPGMHALSGERAMGALGNHDRVHGVVNEPTKEVIGK